MIRLKQLATILFCTIVLFNLGGYRLVTGYLQHRANCELEQRLDQRQYNDADLLSIKTPLNLPYYGSSPGFERVNGELSVKGVVYKYVKRRVYHDTLEVLCIRDAKRTGLQQAREDFYALSNGLAAHTRKPVSALAVKPLFFDYCQFAKSFDFALDSLLLKHTSRHIATHGARTGQVLEEPPEV